MYLNVTVIVKNDGFKTVKMTPEQLGQLSEAIQRQGHEWVTLISGPIDVVGVIIKGEQTGDRVIIFGNSDPTESAQAKPEAV